MTFEVVAKRSMLTILDLALAICDPCPHTYCYRDLQSTLSHSPL